MPTVVFDFDKTLTKKDTVPGFLFTASGKGLIPVRRVIFLFFAVLHKFRLISNDRLKQAGIGLFLQNMDEQVIRQRAAAYAAGIELNNIYKTEFAVKYPTAIIVTASYEDYVKPLFRDNLVLGAQLEVKQGKVTGLAQNAYGPQKVERLHQNGIYKVDIFYTDSFSDRAVMDIAEIVYLVKGDHFKKIKG